MLKAKGRKFRAEEILENDHQQQKQYRIKGTSLLAQARTQTIRTYNVVLFTLSLSLIVLLEMSMSLEWKTMKFVSSVTVKKNFSMPASEINLFNTET